ncbi:ABC transporter ATP-binding protein [Aureimonas phyllosphaerae]|uniref:Peptide/nickel transport system ATP-binding protein n=1 Tax=Aureimonas phyllosphaerae TaxID=1166078 RepID=A0A7W6BSV0_9HYPH|nr:ABC transporter ATP-binding protein [Aureimonas phyllosphaerae]MBB3937386.1 peptide/nickel transport system ATP-binding protein [Aureimonas phyllosphaerae]MBB3961393.1 peptide/nickel transport system ATP-binding protein [Aureimonas phyllosphaerae]SFF42527.1 peptide/nickel transport system ATP-binding protein [Aureimonas phyllosphaerae]
MTAIDPPVLEIRDLTVDFLSDEAPVRAVDGVSLRVRRGETLCILGESGSGKSVSSSTVLDILDTPPAEIVSGQILFEGRDLAAMTPEERRQINGRKIAMIFQDPLAHLNPVYTVGAQICEVFRAHRVCDGAEARRRGIELFGRVGIPDPEARFDRYPHEFSGGQRQRIMIAMAIALGPSLLIADEPTTALDVSVQAQILELLTDLQREFGMALVMITHDLEVAASMADRVIVMRRGRIVEEGEARAVFTRPGDDYTRRLMAAIPSHDGEGGRRSRAPAAETLLDVQGLTKVYQVTSGLFAAPRSVAAVEDVSFRVGRGETLGIVGESGSGKSSVAKMLLRLVDPTAGRALFRGADIYDLEGAELLALRRKVQMVFQDPYGSMNPRMTVEAIISEPWRIHGDILPKAQWRARVRELLDLVGLNPDWAGRHPHQFSGGQRQRIAIARALACDPELIVCDEAVSALDVSVQMQVIDLLADLRDRLGLAYVFITHDLPVVRNFADRIIVMRGGKVVEEADTETLFANPRHEYTRTLLSSSPRPKWETAIAAFDGY